MKKILLFLLLLPIFTFSQVSINSIPFTYNQDFGTSDISSWTNNSTYLGWYATDAATTLHQNITTSIPTNSGGFYTYECKSNNNQKIGSRASSSTNTIYYGVRFLNNTPQTIYSFTIELNWYQLSLAENGYNSNKIDIEYQISNSFTAINSGTWIAFSQFTAPLDTITGTSQVRGLPCNTSGFSAACINVNVLPDQNIAIRFKDIDNTNNDHHTAIDDIKIEFFSTNCMVLAIEDLDFQLEKINNYVKIVWTLDNSYQSYIIEKSNDGFNFQIVTKSSNLLNSYLDIYEDGYIYYRIKYIDFNGNFEYSNIQYITDSNEDFHTIKYYNFLGEEIQNPQGYVILVIDGIKKIVFIP